MAKLLIKNGRVFDGQHFFYADVLTDGGVIARIAPGIRESADTVYDATGETVSAGLVDVHVHMRGISSPRFGIQAEMSCFPFGVTACVDAGGGQGDLALLNSFAIKSAVLVTVPIRDNRPDLAAADEQLRRYGNRAIGFKVYFDTNVSDVRDAQPLREICDHAHERGLFVMVHSSNSPVNMGQILDAMHKGDVLTHAYHGGRHAADEDGYRAMRAARERGVILDAGFAGHVHTDFSVLERAIACGLAPDTVSTDITRYSAYMRGGRYGMTMCMSIARTLGMTEEAVFAAVTSRAAEVIGKAQEWGTLAAGRAADIAVLKTCEESFDLTDAAGHRVTSPVGYRCVLTVSDGQVVYRH